MKSFKKEFMTEAPGVPAADNKEKKDDDKEAKEYKPRSKGEEDFVASHEVEKVGHAVAGDEQFNSKSKKTDATRKADKKLREELTQKIIEHYRLVNIIAEEMKDCEHCDGKGYHKEDGEEKECPECDGTGKVEMNDDNSEKDED